MAEAESAASIACEKGCVEGQERPWCSLHRAPFTVDCPRCGARAGWDCNPLDPNGWRASAPHKARRDLAAQEEDRARLAERWASKGADRAALVQALAEAGEQRG